VRRRDARQAKSAPSIGRRREGLGGLFKSIEKQNTKGRTTQVLISPKSLSQAAAINETEMQCKLHLEHRTVRTAQIRLYVVAYSECPMHAAHGLLVCRLTASCG
jgi:hypothetical protein